MKTLDNPYPSETQNLKNAAWNQLFKPESQGRHAHEKFHCTSESGHHKLPSNTQGLPLYPLKLQEPSLSNMRTLAWCKTCKESANSRDGPPTMSPGSGVGRESSKVTSCVFTARLWENIWAVVFAGDKSRWPFLSLVQGCLHLSSYKVFTREPPPHFSKATSSKANTSNGPFVEWIFREMDNSSNRN